MYRVNIRRRCAMDEMTKASVVHVLEKHEDIAVGLIFGSRARGDEGVHSDVDVAVLHNLSSAEMDFLKRGLVIEAELCLALRTDKVDLIVLNTAPLALAYNAIKDGEVVFVRDEMFYCDFIERTVTNYLDFKPRLDEFRREYHRSLVEEYVGRPGQDPSQDPNDRR